MKSRRFLKRMAAILLSVLMVLSAVSTAAYAANGPMGKFEAPWGESLYLAYIQFLETDEAGDLIIGDDGRIRSHVVFSEDTVYNDASDEELSPGFYKGMENAVYDRQTNTLTVTNLSAGNMRLETNVMGDDFTLNVVGECSIGQITIWGDGYGGTLNIEGNGTLTVNGNNACDNAVILYAEFSDSALNFGSDVTVKLYAKQDAAEVKQVEFDSADKAYSFANGATPQITQAPDTTQTTKMVDGYDYVDTDDTEAVWKLGSAMKAVCSDDPDGIYAVDYFKRQDEEGIETDVYEVLKLIYSEKYGAYFKDLAFSYEHGDQWGHYELTPEQFEASPYTIVYDSSSQAVQLENIYNNNYTLPVYKDDAGKEYGVINRYEDGQVVACALSLNPIEEMDGVYVYKSEPSVNAAALEPVYDIQECEGVYNYTLKGTEFIYTPKPPMNPDILPAFDDNQMVSVGSGQFEDPHFVKLEKNDSFVPVTGSVTYQIGDNVYSSHDELKAFLAAQSAGAVIQCKFTFTGSGDYAGFSDSGTLTFTMVAGVDAVNITIDAPQTGRKLAGNATVTGTANSKPVNSGCLLIDSIKWSPKVSTAAADTAYTVTITVRTDRGVGFAKAVTAKVNGATARQSTLSGEQLTLTYTFARTAKEYSFSDVKRSAYYYRPVQWAVENNITKGTDKAHFSPEQSCTRAQLVTFLWRALGCPKPKSTANPFVDIKPGQYYYNAVLWATEKGITNGVDRTHFGPEESVSRAQTVTFLYRAAGQPKVQTNKNPFTDLKKGAYYVKPVLWAVENGITNGSDSTHFSPEQICTRAQIVTFLYRFDSLS